MNRNYYLERTGAVVRDEQLSFEMLKRAFKIEYDKLYDANYFQKAFGFACDYEGFIPGTYGKNVSGQVFLQLGRDNLWPIHDKLESYDQGELFSIIELVYDACAKPTKQSGHDECVHVDESDSKLGKEEFRKRMNPHLRKFANVELSVNGEILDLPEKGFEKLLSTPIASTDKENVTDRIDAAVVKFRRANATTESRKEALRGLADVLEYIKKDIQSVLMSKDENELFLIANNFGIRHHNAKQKTDYDQPAWHAWMFYCYLSTIHLCLYLKEKQKSDRK